MNWQSTVWASWLLLSSGVMAAEKVYDPVTIQPSWVKAVYDGDTFTVDIPNWPAVIGAGISVRVSGIDAPERTARDSTTRVQAAQARMRTVAILRGAQVIELRQVKRDKYFRLNAEVFVDGRSLGEILLREGLAKPYTGEGPKPVW